MICEENIVGMPNLLSCVNDITHGLFGLFIVVGIWMIIYFANRGEPASQSIVGASWIALLAAILLRLVGGIDDVYLGMAFVVAIGSLALMKGRASL